MTQVNLPTMIIDERTAELCRLVHLIVSSIADDVASIAIEPVLTAEHRTIIQVQASRGDRGKLIGREGRVAEALRHYIRAYQLQHGGSYGFDLRGTDT